MWFVDLGPLTEPAFVAPAIASAMGVVHAPGQPILDTRDRAPPRSQRPARPGQLRARPRRRGAARSTRCSARCGLLRVLATSREGLAHPRARPSFPVPSLASPATGDPRPPTCRSTKPCGSSTSGQGGGSRVPDHRRERRRGCPDLPSPRRRAAGDRARRGAGPCAAGRADRRPAGRPLPAADRLQPGRPFRATRRCAQTIDWSHDLLDEDERARLPRASQRLRGRAARSRPPRPSAPGHAVVEWPSSTS